MMIRSGIVKTVLVLFQGNSIYFLEDKFLFTQIKLVLFVGTGVLLRFGHARALTTIQVVIHSPYAASLPRLSA